MYMMSFPCLERILRSIPRLKYFCQALSSSSSYLYVKKLPPPLVRKVLVRRARPFFPARPNSLSDQSNRLSAGLDDPFRSRADCYGDCSSTIGKWSRLLRCMIELESMAFSMVELPVSKLRRSYCSSWFATSE
uniref:Uncharacterized protein n=1 Tax=Anopheles coluzzii TaxID=1518534 RepID=A0A8W7PQ32_ANOCL